MVEETLSWLQSASRTIAEEMKLTAKIEGLLRIFKCQRVFVLASLCFSYIRYLA
jgi:hypothetical protein